MAEVAVVEDSGQTALELSGVAPFSDVRNWPYVELVWFADRLPSVEDGTPFALVGKIGRFVENVSLRIVATAVVNVPAQEAVVVTASGVNKAALKLIRILDYDDIVPESSHVFVALPTYRPAIFRVYQSVAAQKVAVSIAIRSAAVIYAGGVYWACKTFHGIDLPVFGRIIVLAPEEIERVEPDVACHEAVRERALFEIS